MSRTFTSSKKLLKQPNLIFVNSRIRQLSKDRRNAVRGIISSAEAQGLRDKHINDLRENGSLKDMMTASEILNGPGGLRRRLSSRLKQGDIWGPHGLKCRSTQMEVAYAASFLNQWPVETSKALGTIKLLSKFSSVAPKDAAIALKHAASEWGASVFLCQKIAFLKSCHSEIASDPAILEADKILGHLEDPEIQFSMIASFSDAISLFSIARRHASTLRNIIKDDFRKAQSLHHLMATPISETDCGNFVLRASETSLLDCVHSLYILVVLREKFADTYQAIEKCLSPDILEEILCTIHDIECSSVIDRETLIPQNVDIDDYSLSAERRSAAFTEVPNVCRFRSDLDTVIGYRLISSLLPNIPAPLDDVFDDIDVILKESESFEIAEHRTANPKVDTFYRTYLFMRFLQNPYNLGTLTERSVKFIFNNTMGLEYLLKERELQNMHASAKEETRALISVLALALHRRRSLDGDIDFDFRERLEDYICAKYNGNAVDFITHLTEDSPGVASYIATSLDDATLQKMYRIVRSPDEARNVRRDILFAMGVATNRIEFILEAEAIETRSKVSKIKNYFDTSRMFVDSVAMRKWFDANPSTHAEQYKELLPKITAKLSKVKNISSSSGASATIELIELSSTDDYLATQVAKEAFKEFCTNNEFGIESFLGRRIRHNTLHGVMTNGVDAVLQRSEFLPILSGTPFGQALEAWENSFMYFIEKLRREILQFRSPHKPQAIFASDVDPLDPATRRNLQQLIQSLRISGPEMLYELIISFCWRQIAPQLEAASTQLRVNFSREMASSLDMFTGKFGGPEEVRVKAELQSALKEIFAQVASWFRVPETGFVPASISDICQIIDIDLGREANPTKIISDASNTKYQGISVHRLYDCLAALIQNAHKHGVQGSEIVVRCKSIPLGSTNVHRLQISISSQMPGDEIERSVERVRQAIESSETGSEMVTEGFTGIKKVKFITKLNEGGHTVEMNYLDSEMEISFHIKAEVAAEGEEE